jgi:hypothetical protein
MFSHTAIFYTHNAIDARVLELSLRHFQNMVGMYGLPFKTHGVVVSCEAVNTFLTSVERRSVTNLIAPVEIRNLGHLSIVEKITLAIETFPSDFVSLHEHDVLYPEDYLEVCQGVLKDYANMLDYVSYDRIMGVNQTGYVGRSINDTPLSCLSFPTRILKLHLLSKREEIKSNSGWCYLEPGYWGSTGGNLRKLSVGAACTHPIVHVNMNSTSKNHHFTNHYLTYESISKNGFTEWPGDLSYLFS